MKYFNKFISIVERKKRRRLGTASSKQSSNYGEECSGTNGNATGMNTPTYDEDSHIAPGDMSFSSAACSSPDACQSYPDRHTHQTIPTSPSSRSTTSSMGSYGSDMDISGNDANPARALCTPANFPTSTNTSIAPCSQKSSSAFRIDSILQSSDTFPIRQHPSSSSSATVPHQLHTPFTLHTPHTPHISHTPHSMQSPNMPRTTHALQQKSPIRTNGFSVRQSVGFQVEQIVT